MSRVAESHVQEVRFRTELNPKGTSWVVVGIVYLASIGALYLVVDFLNSYSEFADIAERLGEEVPTELKEASTRAKELRFHVTTRAVFLGTAVFIALLLGGTFFLVRCRDLEEQLVQRAAEIDEMDKSRRLFFAKASHELRTPVTAIRGEAEVALAYDHDDHTAMQQALRDVVAHATFLGHRIEEMIGLARTADGKLHLDALPLDFRDVVFGAVDDAHWFATTAEVELAISVPDQPVLVVGDFLWLKRALVAVIENALKFSPIGQKVSVELRENDSRVTVIVTDRGAGVDANELPHVFDAYYQTRSGRERGGSGLGLAMTRWVVEQHGGSASVRNLGLGRRNTGCAVAISISKELDG